MPLYSLAHDAIKGNATIPASVLPGLSFTASCGAGFGPSTGLKSSPGSQQWICEANPDQPIGVWKQSNGQPTNLTCSTCPSGALCPGVPAQGAILACPAATFQPSMGASACQNCDGCCSPCDPLTGACATRSTPGCNIGGKCVAVDALKPLAQGCASCKPALSIDSW